MIPLSDFHPDIALSVGNIHTPIIDNAVIAAAIEFCDKTHLWEEWLNPITVNPSISEYPIDCESTMKLIVLKEVIFNDRELIAEPLVNLQRMSVTWRTEESAYPLAYYMSAPGVIALYPKLNDLAEGEIRLLGTFKPHRKSKELPDFIYDDYYDAIVAGAESRLHTMKGKAWYSPADSIEKKKEFSAAISAGKIRAFKSRTTGSYKLRIRGAA